MVKVWVRREGGFIRAYRVEGHAGWAQAGKDIVCSAISALVIAAENGLDEVAGAIESSGSSEGRLDVVLKGQLDASKRMKADAILDTMLNALKKIQGDYPGSIKIYE